MASFFRENHNGGCAHVKTSSLVVFEGLEMREKFKRAFHQRLHMLEQIFREAEVKKNTRLIKKFQLYWRFSRQW